MAKMKRKEAGVEMLDSTRQQIGGPATEVVAPQMVGDTTAAGDERQRLAERAYELYLARGGAEGGDLDDWLQAERELRGARRGTHES